VSEPVEPDERSAGLLHALAEHLVAGIIKAKNATLPMEHAAKWAATTDYLEGMETEAAPLTSALFKKFTDTPGFGDDMRAVFDLMGDPDHQWDAILQAFGLVGAIMVTVGFMGQLEMRAAQNVLNAQYNTLPLSPADCADAVVKGHYQFQEGLAEASKSGISEEAFEVMFLNTGEPPGPMDILSLWRRGLITEEFVDQAILNSRLKDIYVPTVKLLAHSYMTPADCIELAVKGIKSPDDARVMFGIAGGLDDQWNELYLAAGNAIGPAEAMTLWNHKLIDETQVDSILGRSRINPVFYDIAKLQRHHYLSVIQIELALKAGTVTGEAATVWLTEMGYPADQIAAFTKAAAKGPVTKAKSETEAMVVESYANLLITASEATAELEQLGYTSHAAAFVIAVEDAKRVHAQLRAATAGIEAAYKAHKITEAQVKADLTKLEVPSAAIDGWVKAWDVENSTVTKEFTTAQVGGLMKKGILNEPDAIKRWEAMGWSESDAQLLAYDYGEPVPQ
jgi:hypothetical protein